MVTVRSVPILIMIVVLVLAGLTNGFANAATDSPELRVGSERDFPPYAFIDESGQPVGFSVDLIKAVAKAMSLPIKISTGTWNDLWNALVAGRLDILPIVAKLPDRLPLVDFSLPHTETFDAFFVRHGNPSLNNIEAASGKNIVVMRSDAAHHELLGHNFQGNIVLVDTIPEGLSLISSGKYDAFLGSKLIGTLLINKHGIKDLDAGPIIPDYKRVFSFAVKKGNADLLEKLNQGLLIIKTNGEYDRIYDKWLTGADPWRKWRKYFWPAIVIVIAIVLIGSLWLLLLQLQVKKRTRQLSESNKMLRLAQDGLEEKVAYRTVELANANVELQSENTERKKVEEALRDSEARFRSLFESMTEGVVLHEIIYDEHGMAVDYRIISTNSAFEKQTGLKSEQVQGQLASATYGIGTAPYLEIYAQVAYSGQPHSFDIFFPPMQRYFHISVSSPKQGQFVTVFSNITQLKRAQDALREREEKFRLVFEKAPLGIMHYDQTSTFTDCNEKFAEIIGSSKEKVIGFNMMRQLRDDKMREAVALSLKSKMGYYEGDYLSVLSGKTTPVRAIYQPIFSEDGAVSGGVAIFEDISERKQAEEAFQSLVRSAPMGIYIVQDGKFSMVNPGFEVITGYHAQELIGQHCLNPVSPEFRAFVREQALLRLKEEGLPPYEYQFITKNGETGWVMETVTPTQYQGKQAVMGYFMDISPLVEMEEQFLRVQKMEAVGTLAGGIAHDFNNILTAILGNIGLAALDDKIGPRGKDRLAQAEAACLQAHALSHQLLTFAKGGAPVKELFSVAELLTKSTAFTCVGSSVKCETTFPENLWWIEADPGQIDQVCQNLTINAIQAMPTGRMIKIWAENLTLGKDSDFPLGAGRYIKISVRDQGMGISPEHLTRIFDPYFTTKQKGSGLGLASTYVIIKKHQGHIAVESKPGVGTTFTIYLPAVDQQVTPHPEKDRELLVGTGKILVMDDEDMVREVLGRLLARLGYESEFAGDGGKAIEIFVQAQRSGQAFAGVILDLTVPGAMGGKETMARLLEIDPQVKAVVSSGYSDDPIMAEFAKYGFSGVIAKPYRISELGKILHDAIMIK